MLLDKLYVNFFHIQAAKAEQIEQRILQQENEISNMENRNYFSLHCVQLETQLIHANLEGLYIALAIMSTVESKAHSEVRAKSRVLEIQIRKIISRSWQLWKRINVAIMISIE